MERWTWPVASWLEPVASEALLRELLVAYRAGQPTDTLERALEPEVAVIVAGAKAKDAAVLSLGRDSLVRGEGMTPDEPLQRAAAERPEYPGAAPGE